MGSDFNDFGSLFIKSYRVSSLMNLLLSSLNFYQNNYSITKDSKSYRVFSKILSDLSLFKVANVGQ